MRRIALLISVRPSVVLTLVLLASACAPKRDSTFVRALAVGDRAKTAGRHLEAAESYERAAGAGPAQRDRDYALRLAAASYADAQNRADAARIYDSLAAGRGEYAARAAFERALLDLASDPNVAVPKFHRFVLDHHGSPLARRALFLRLTHDDAAKTPEGRLAILNELLPRLRKTDMEERVRYEIALTHEQAGNLPHALEELLAVARDFPYPQGNLFDDALFRASEIEERLGNRENAVAHLERLLQERETTGLVGSYERPKYGPAALRVATLYRDRFGDLRRARDAYWRIVNEFVHSTSRDDALFEIALLSRRLKDEPEACRATATLVKKFPDSRYVGCAPRLCATFTSDAKARERDCAAYIERKITGTGG